ncbi:MAG TPA: response regulator [Acetobacteraceae bacterium]|jgi:CheY-like chemotaxis protein|nr:response regulator [Acetobacteraceae bacterium]
MSLRLLIVDDDSRLTRIVSLAATQLGMETMQVNRPAEALDAFVSFRPDVILLDVFMPELDGIDVLHEVLLANIPTRLILTSGSGEELLSVARDAARFHGVEDAIVLPKPFRRNELLAALAQAVE